MADIGRNRTNRGFGIVVRAVECNSQAWLTGGESATEGSLRGRDSGEGMLAVGVSAHVVCDAEVIAVESSAQWSLALCVTC
jgi:hypothetical protein